MASGPAERVAAYIGEHELLAPAQPVLALVSGGADSLCLWGLLRELGYPVSALHVDHGLRGPASQADAEFCAGLGAEVAEIEVEPGGNLEARARDGRYAAARERAAGRPIATGHTLTDQAETVLYRLASSSGPRAVAGMRPRFGDVVRPLMCLTASDTRAWCRAAGLEPRHDDSNDDLAIRRNLIRHQVLPLLRTVHEGADQNLARTAELMAELDDLLGELADPHVGERIDLDALAELPRGLRVLVLRRAAERAAGRPLRLPRELTGRLEAVAGRRVGVERLSLARDLEAVRDRTVLSFSPGARYSAPR
ncbi:MAG: tRNA lysidine(34) synthetase TilS [Gaiellales bacterium]